MCLIFHAIITVSWPATVRVIVKLIFSRFLNKVCNQQWINSFFSYTVYLFLTVFSFASPSLLPFFKHFMFLFFVYQDGGPCCFRVLLFEDTTGKNVYISSWTATSMAKTLKGDINSRENSLCGETVAQLITFSAICRIRSWDCRVHGRTQLDYFSGQCCLLLEPLRVMYRLYY
jgi:hypothetical protein